MTHSYPKEKIKVLLLEGIDPSAERTFRENGYGNVQTLKTAPEEKELLKLLKDTFILGVRSRTLLPEHILHKAPKLLTVGCFCIGTDQVALDHAAMQGIPVFNAPHSNTRSVAELVIGLSIMLMRDIFPKSLAAHEGKWLKSAEGSHEIRGKTIGIVGYGHIGSQVSVLAESMGMRVIYYDILTKLPLGNAVPAKTMEEVLKKSDIVTLHVPDTEQTRNLLDRKALNAMKKGSSLINASRGKVVDLDALTPLLKDKTIKGAALDVFPQEPDSLDSPFESPLRGLPNVILTPHIGGSTLEAQVNIGLEVSRKLIHYSDRGSTEGAVNFPSLTLAPHKDAHRILHIHRNIPGILKQINQRIADNRINILGQHLLTNDKIGYVVLDMEKKVTKELVNSLKEIEGTLQTRVLY